jgi:SAM-dependent methyltransferase
MNPASPSVCEICGGRDFARVGSSEDWLRVARGAGDERARMARLVEERPELAFGDLVRCAGCGLVTVSRIPAADALGAFYESYYASGNYAGKRDKKIARAGRRIARLRRLAPGTRFLDVGCNQGFSVEAARRLGLDATGIDIDGAAVARAAELFPGARFEASTTQDFARRGERYDVVYCAEVIEHLPEVVPFVEALAALTRPGGVLYLTTPDAGHLAVPRDFLSWPEVKPPEHLRWFSKANLRRLFAAHGFGPVRFGLSLKPGIRMVARRSGG